MKSPLHPSSVMVFKTSVETPESVRQLRKLLDATAGRRQWNFALDDQDKILRVQSPKITVQQTIHLMNKAGYSCEELKDE